jgi:hypothetical protein
LKKQGRRFRLPSPLRKKGRHRFPFFTPLRFSNSRSKTRKALSNPLRPSTTLLSFHTPLSRLLRLLIAPDALLAINNSRDGARAPVGISELTGASSACPYRRGWPDGGDVEDNGGERGNLVRLISRYGLNGHGRARRVLSGTCDAVPHSRERVVGAFLPRTMS